MISKARENYYIRPIEVPIWTKNEEKKKVKENREEKLFIKKDGNPKISEPKIALNFASRCNRYITRQYVLLDFFGMKNS